MKRFFFSLFFSVAFLEMAGILFTNPTLTFFAKPMLVFSLILYYRYAEPQPSSLFITALVFCWAGDVLLMFQEKNGLFFIFGLLSFLIGHLFFIFTYRQIRYDESDDSLMGTQKVRFAFPIILAGTGLVVSLYPNLGEMRIPVAVYGLVITIMVLNASFRYGRTSVASYWLVFTGAFLFMTSDSILALNKFKQPFPHAEFYIMLSYIAAQFLIVQGVIAHPKKN